MIFTIVVTFILRIIVIVILFSSSKRSQSRSGIFVVHFFFLRCSGRRLNLLIVNENHLVVGVRHTFTKVVSRVKR